MKILIQPEWKDYLRAQYLHFLPNPLSSIITIGVVSLTGLVGLASVVFYDELMGPVILIPTLAGAGLTLIYHYTISPWRTKKIFKQGQELPAPLEIEITRHALVISIEFEPFEHPWSEFIFWKEDEDTLILYYKSSLFTILPKHFLSVTQIEAIKTYLRANQVQSNSSSRSQRIFFVLLNICVILFFILLLYRQLSPLLN